MYGRRTVLAGALGTLAAVAGCQAPGAAEDTPTATDTATETATPTEGGSGTPTATAETDYGGWFADTDNFDGTVDVRGESSVSVAVGAEGNGGNFAFDPAAIRVDPGTAVVWEWTGAGGAHNVVGEDDDFSSGEPVSEAGTTYERTFDAEGIHRYFCSPHRSLGMKGAVVVGEPGD